MGGAVCDIFLFARFICSLYRLIDTPLHEWVNTLSFTA
jgi:hypothetical protein